MAKRDHAINTYVSEMTKNEVTERAREADKTVSTYVADLIQREMQREATDNLSSEYRAEQRLQELIALGKDEMREVAREIADMHAKTGTYAAANFELLKHDYKPAQRTDALSTGSRRVREPLDETLASMDLDADDDGDPVESSDHAGRDLDERLGGGD